MSFSILILDDYLQMGEKKEIMLLFIRHIYTLMSKIIFTYPKMMIFKEISNQCDPYLQGMRENQA